MTQRRNLFLAFLSLILLFGACGTAAEQEVNFSDSGLIPEAYLPDDLGMVVSYSTRDDEQFAAVQALEEALGDEDRVSRTASETLDSKLGNVGLDFERDLKPAFGEQFHMVYGLRSTETDPENFAVITLEDPDKMKEVLKTLVIAEQLSYKKLSEVDVYTKEDSQVYLAIYEDMLFIASNGENLVAMTEQKEEESLWASDKYQDTLKEVGGAYVLYGVIYPALYSGDISLLAGLSVSDVSSVMDEQVVVVSAEDKGLRFDAWANANKDQAKEAGVSFDIVPKSEPYLFEEIPAEGLMAYVESYGFAQTFTQEGALGEDTTSLEQMQTFTRNYLGMDFEDLMSFMDKGYVVAIHQNGSSIIPGITIYVDASSNPEQAEAFVNKLDGQLSGLLLVAEQVLPGAITKDTTTWGEDTFSRIKFDLSALPQSEETPLPSSLTASSIELVYGFQNDRVIISTATSWDSEGGTVDKSALYKDLSSQITEQSEGLILLDTQGISEFIGMLQDLQGQLGTTPNEDVTNIRGFLEGFLGAIAQSETEKYKSHFGGFLMLAD
ncbi:MAG: DUF3352 domain-containing protein [Candidatus Gracilibacteria bacterium]